MKRLLFGKVGLIAALAVLIAGGAVAAIAATSGSTGNSSGAHSAHSARDASDDLAAHHTSAPTNELTSHSRRSSRRNARMIRLFTAAASYLGLTARQLRSELRAGKSLAPLAGATPGKSEAGLINAIEAAQRNKLAQAAARLSRRVSSVVRTPGGPLASRRESSLRAQARAYLGLTAAQLRSDSRSGRSLAQIAAATPGRSEAGLVEALLSGRTQQLEKAVSAGTLNAREESSRIARLRKRIGANVQRELPQPRRSARTRATPSS